VNIDEAVNKACQQPALLDALSWICVWESERAIRQAQASALPKRWETCFRYCLKQVIDNYKTDEDFA